MALSAATDSGNGLIVKVPLAIAGSAGHGWQKQDGNASRTVQGALEDALRKMHKTQVNVTGSGRTDSGVHAVGQVANFYTNMRGIPPDRFAPALNSLLPSDVRIISASEASADFHARFDAAMRTYRYHFIGGRILLPHESR